MQVYRMVSVQQTYQYLDTVRHLMNNYSFTLRNETMLQLEVLHDLKNYEQHLLVSSFIRYCAFISLCVHQQFAY